MCVLELIIHILGPGLSERFDRYIKKLNPHPSQTLSHFLCGYISICQTYYLEYVKISEGDFKLGLVEAQNLDNSHLEMSLVPVQITLYLELSNETVIVYIHSLEGQMLSVILPVIVFPPICLNIYLLFHSYLYLSA